MASNKIKIAWRYRPSFYVGPYYVFFDWGYWSRWSRYLHFYPPGICDAHLDEFIVCGPMRVRRLYHEFELCTRDGTYGWPTPARLKKHG